MLPESTNGAPLLPRHDDDDAEEDIPSIICNYLILMKFKVLIGPKISNPKIHPYF